MGHTSPRRTVHIRSGALRGRPHTATRAPKSVASRPWTSGPRRSPTMSSPCAMPSGRTAALTHWSFEQLATIAGAPPKYLRTLPAPIASAAINHGLQRQRREQHQLFADQAAPWTVRAITSPRYARVHHDELAGRVLDLMAVASRLAVAARLQGRRVRRRTGSVRRLPGRSRHVPVPRGRQP